MKRALITGANRGIGLEFCRQLKKRDWQVVGLCRRAGSKLPGIADLVVEDVDIGEPDQIEKAAANYTGGPINLLVNNAGVFAHDSFEDLDYQNLLRNFRINGLGPLWVAKGFRPHLLPQSKVAVITSRMGSIADNGSGHYYAYRMSKAALNMAAKSMAVDLKKDEITILVLHPGFVRTEMTNGQGDIDPEQAVSGMLRVIENKAIDQSGGFWHSNGQSLPW